MVLNGIFGQAEENGDRWKTDTPGFRRGRGGEDSGPA